MNCIFINCFEDCVIIYDLNKDLLICVMNIVILFYFIIIMKIKFFYFFNWIVVYWVILNKIDKDEFLNFNELVYIFIY